MKYNSIGEQLIAKAKELDPSYKPDKFNDMSEAIDVILNNTGGSGGGKSVPPTLNLFDFENSSVRTTITEEEYNNLKNGLYNQVVYAISGNNFFPVYSPSKLFNIGGEYGFAQFKMLVNADGIPSYSFMNIYLITIGEKNTSNEYPITITEELEINPPSAGGGGSSKVWYELPSLFFLENITQEQFDAIKNLVLQNQLAGINCAGLYCPLTFYNDGRNIDFFYPWYENDIFTAYIVRLDADLSVKKIPYSTITLPQTAPTSQLIPSITTTNKQQNLTIGNGLEIKNGALQEKVLTISITDILTDNSKIQELFSKMTSTTEQSALILFDNPISYDKYKDYDTIKLDLSPLSSMSISGYYILKNQSHVNGFTPVYSLNTIGMEYSGSNLNKLVVKNLFITGNDEVNTPLNKFLLKIL